jgi:hypothetical protein
MAQLKPDRIAKIIKLHLAGQTAREISTALRLRIGTVEAAIAGERVRPTSTAIATPNDFVLRDELANRRAELCEKAKVTPQEISRVTRGQLVEVQHGILGILHCATKLLQQALDDGEPHSAQMYAVVLGISLDQSHKIIRELRDLSSESQEDQETGWVVVVRDDEAPDGA